MLDFENSLAGDLSDAAPLCIPSLSAVYVLPCAWLSPDIRILALSAVRPVVAAEPLRLHIFGKASLTYEASVGDLSAKTELRFHCAAPVESPCPVAFIAETPDGILRLVGAAEPPFPVVKSSASTGESPSAAASVEVTVSWSSRPVIVLAPMRPGALPPLP